MSSGCGDVLSLEDLKTAKKHQTFEAEVITGKAGGVASGADIEYATNQVTGQVQKTMPAVLRDIGYEIASFDFSTGGTLNSNDRNKVVIWPAPSGNGSYYSWKGSLPKVIPAGSSPATTGGESSTTWVNVSDLTLRNDLSDTDGTDLIGDKIYTNLTDSLSSRFTIFQSVSDMVSKNFSFLSDKYYAQTLSNFYGVKRLSRWIISSIADTTTYSVAVGGSKYANLICHEDMSYADFGFGGTDVENVAAVNEGNRVARAQAIVRSLSFPAGIYQIGAFTLDVDKRAFRFWGAGWDSTTLVSTTSGISMHHLGIDPRDRSRDKLHFYQEVGGFMLDGNIDGNGASAASRSICTAHYAELSYKSVGHRLSNVDISALVVHWKGHTQSRTNGATITQYGLRVRYNSIKLDGYIGGASTTVACAIGGPKTTLTSTAAVGATTINVASVSGFNLYDIIEIQGGSNLEAPYIIGISTGVLTLDKPLVSAHSSGAAVAVPVVSTSVTGTIEVGQIQISDSTATEIHGMYSEESKIYISGYVQGLEIHGNSIAEASPTIQLDAVDKRSFISIHDNYTAFSITINAPDRLGMATTFVDPSTLPYLDIRGNTRAQNNIVVNSNNVFRTLRITRTYDTTLTDVAFTRMEFDGLYFERAAGAGFGTSLSLTHAPTLLGYDGYSFDVTATCRRSTSVTAGIFKRIGGSSTDGTTNTTNMVPMGTSYSLYNASTGVDISFGATASRATIDCRGEASGGQTTKFALSGTITSIV